MRKLRNAYNECITEYEHINKITLNMRYQVSYTCGTQNSITFVWYMFLKLMGMVRNLGGVCFKFIENAYPYARSSCGNLGFAWNL